MFFGSVDFVQLK